MDVKSDEITAVPERFKSGASAPPDERFDLYQNESASPIPAAALKTAAWIAGPTFAILYTVWIVLLSRRILRSIVHTEVQKTAQMVLILCLPVLGPLSLASAPA